MTSPLSDTRLTEIRERARRMIADKVVYAQVQYAEDYSALLAEVDRLSADLARERAERDQAVDRSLQRLSRGIDVTLARKEAERQRDEARAELAAAKNRIHAASTVKCWTNEDGRRFVFAEDLAFALGYTPAAPDDAGPVRCSHPDCSKVSAPLGWAREPWLCPDHVAAPSV